MYPFVAYLVCLIVVYLSGQHGLAVSESEYFKTINGILFITSLGLFVGLGVNQLFKIKFRYLSKRSIVSAMVASLASVYIVFIHLKNIISGRFGLYPLLLSNSFDDTGLLDYFGGIDPRSSQAIIYDIYQFIFNIGVQLDQLLFINKILSIGILLAVYFIAKEILQRYYLALLVLLTFAASSFAQFNLTSFEHGTPAILLALLSMFFGLKYQKEKSRALFILSGLSLISATFFRYELAVLFGLPYLLGTSFVFKTDKKDFKYFTILCAIMIIRSIPIMAHMAQGDDVNLHGAQLSDPTTLPLVKNSLSVLIHNFRMGDFNLSSGHYSLFLPASLLGAVASLVMLLKKDRSVITRQISFLSVIMLFIFFTIITTHIEGLRSGEKYSINYFIAEIVIAYYWIFKLSGKRFQWLGNILCTAFFALALQSNHFFKIKQFPAPRHEYGIYQEFKGTNFDKSCSLIKRNSYEPLIDFFYPLSMKYVMLDELPPIPNGHCFYLFEDYYINNTIEETLASCQKSRITGKTGMHSIIEYRCPAL